MNLDICRKCPYWTEFLLAEDTCDVSMRCYKSFDCRCKVAFPDADIDSVRKIIDRSPHRDLMYGLFGDEGQLYAKALSFCGGDAESRMQNELIKHKVPDNCIYMAEQYLEDWNK